MKSSCIRLFAALAALSAARGFAAPPAGIVLDSDIGTDVDDAYALVLAARSPYLKLLGVTTVNADTAARAAIARKLLLLMDCGDVPVAAGRSKARDGHKPFWGGWEGKGLLAEGEVVEGVSPLPAAELIADIVSRSEEKVVIVVVGGLGNIADVLETRPETKSRIERLVIMGGCVHPLVVEGHTLPERIETNLHNDVDAAALVLTAGLPITLVPAEVTFRTNLYQADFARIEADDSPLAVGMANMTNLWTPGMKGFMRNLGVEHYYDDGAAMLHDPLAVYSLIEPDAVETQPAQLRLETGPGTIRTVADAEGTIDVDLVTGADFERLSRAVADAVIGVPGS